jgi:glycosyltransferase involved in cell wall biosynthesis
MNIQPKVALIVPLYNQAKYLPMAVNDKIGVDFIRVFIICDGDASLLTLNLLKSYQNIKNFHILYQKNSGLPAARNLGILHALENYPDVEFILPLDADDKLSALEIKLMWLKYKESEEKYGRKTVIYPRIVEFGQRNVDHYPRPGQFSTYDHIYRNNLPYTLLMPKEVFTKHKIYYKKGKLPFDWSEDWHFGIRLLHAGYLPIHQNSSILFYRVKSNSMAEIVQNNYKQVKDAIIQDLINIYDAGFEIHRLKELKLINKHEHLKRYEKIENLFAKINRKNINYKIKFQNEREKFKQNEKKIFNILSEKHNIKAKILSVLYDERNKYLPLILSKKIVNIIGTRKVLVSESNLLLMKKNYLNLNFSFKRNKIFIKIVKPIRNLGQLEIFREAKLRIKMDDYILLQTLIFLLMRDEKIDIYFNNKAKNRVMSTLNIKSDTQYIDKMVLDEI